MIHCIGFVHTRYDEDAFSHCAYTAKVVRWVEMMADVGEEITVYWGGDEPVSTAGLADFVSLMSAGEQEHFFGFDLATNLTALDWDPQTEPWVVLNHRAAAALYARIGPEDVVCVLSGSNHDRLFAEFPYLKFLEPWVGYTGISTKTYAKVYESSAWRHLLAGAHAIQDGQPLDAVIPNYYRPSDFEIGVDLGYLLYIGRMIKRKGVEDAVRIARRSGRKLVLAGQRAERVGTDITCEDGTVLDTKGMDVDYLGVVGPEERRTLYAHASATLVPTLYWEPFGGVFAEAMMSGVIPVCRDWGAFVEYVPDQARFSTLDQAPEALEWAVAYRGMQVRDTAIERFSTAACAKQFSHWLGRVRR